MTTDPAPHPLVFIVVLNWNGWRDTVECLDALRFLRYPNFRVLVVDNASGDGSVAELRARFPELEIIENPANLGFAAGNNVGIRRALTLGADYVWLLNNDTAVSSGALGALVELAERDPRAGVVGSVLREYAVPNNIQAWGGGALRPWLGTTTQFTQARGEVDHVIGASMLLRAGMLRAVGPLDEDFFFFMEDTELSLRARRAGWRVRVAPGSWVFHKGGSSLRAAGGHRNLAADHLYAESNGVYLAKYSGVPALLVRLFTLTLRRLGRGEAGRALPVAASLWRGYWAQRRRDRQKARPRRALYDARWTGHHGIARFSREVLSRLPAAERLTRGDPLSLLDPLRVAFTLLRARPPIYFSPGFNPPLFSPVPFMFTIHDLIHLDVPEESSFSKQLYYALFVRPAARRAFRVLTVSEYSRKRIAGWAGIPLEKVVVVGAGADARFSPDGPAHAPGYPYILCVANRKPHRNLPRLLEAFALLDDSDLRLVLSGDPDPDTVHLALRLGVYSRLVFAGLIPEAGLPAYYRGATLVAVPSLYEGFGLPALEAMACGTPVACSDATSLPEVVGDAALLFNPHDAGAIMRALSRLLGDAALRDELRRRGLERATRFSWERTASLIAVCLSTAGR